MKHAPKSLFRTRIKFCGFTRPGDVRLACELGADAIGFVFAESSKRRVEAEEARAMRQALAPLVDAVALFMDNPAEQVREVVRQVRPSLLQFHGDENDGFCRSFGVPYLKAVAMGEGGEPASASPGLALHARYPAAAGFLLDSHVAGGSGGSGKTFDWSRIPLGMHKPFLLAGGLVPDNVYEAILATRPWGVDVSSGIESAPGLKDGDLMRRFVEEVRRADCHSD
ncbi:MULTISPECIES: phosphoribosylanthranilate isomerase [unclassified Lysobacter]|uniref:phosphoribosylanthranilate isomerase n=1 Tax=unclassified Lysobacter TaxID=2635362 RepID=UPI0006F3D9AA|nr:MULTISPECIES: phosphoribosylanthranilate isomerase [unclassified Lysobacter]KRA74772.1 N-(5'-phosphoribosyl)anthranilate isomerase [Lysobacter sp. Root667]KRC38216.1 N-(5'-phosphoribosyl)anthranilate isomerase [Lysobacter sp. Root76]KRD69540.1 N-(5'-phosphoribosyl)anthranilate isomerase [Lysobacter sp. Root96]